MTLDDWPRVKVVLEGALALDAGERQAYLTETCNGDAVLRARVETLLAAQEPARCFLETPAALVLEQRRVREDLSGRTVSCYRLRARIGEGGMGEVYLADDTKLDRPVALKFLSPELAADPARLRRFHQEARAASSLNHPHIVVVHDFGELNGRPYMVTEFVEGETLRRRLERGPLAAHDVVDIGIQVAGALAAAHARGLVHRDVKPDNIMVRPDGYVKVLDFGLAKLASHVGASEMRDPDGRTQPGALIGTPAYMSPEQARGLDLDPRSDVWSAGVVLYEMLAGRLPFDAATPADAIAAILGTDPLPIDAGTADIASGLTAIIANAMRKDHRERYRDAGELLAELRRVASSGTTATRDEGAPAEEDTSTLSPSGERRRVTVLVSVVSDYASLVEQLAAPEIERLIRAIRAAAVDTVRQHGGVVNQSIGEELVSLFGIPTAHEDDDLRAVRAAIELHARVRRLGGASRDEQRPDPCLQSGVHAGSVVAQRLSEGPRRFAVTGSPVQFATRLAGSAAPDAILVSPDCHRLISPFVRSEPRDPVVLQAGAPPVTPHCVLGESGLANRLEAFERGGLTPYRGRAAELTALQAQVESARRGDGRCVLIAGEAGSGKSRMLHELRARVAPSDVRILQGRCRSYGAATAYLPFVEALRGALAVKEQDGGPPQVAELVARVRAIDASLEPFIPLYLHLMSVHSDLFPVPRHLRGEHFQAALLDALAAMFTSSTREGPLLLLLEDWHWADDASRQALRHLSDVVAACPLLIVVTTRPEPGTLPDVLDHIALDHATRITLRPLDFGASLAIVKSVLGVTRIPNGLAERLHERTGGNPFFLEEMCHALREAGLLETRGPEAVIAEPAGALQLPGTVQSVIRSRLDRLDPDGRALLRVASVIGREFGRRTLAEAMGGGDLSGAIDRLKTAGMIQQIGVVPEPVYRFRHVLTQEVTYDSLLEHQRKTLHQAVGRAMERCRPGSFEQPLELLAHHFSRGEAWDEAIAYGLQAADRATELSQFADALTMLERVRVWLLRLPGGSAPPDRLIDVLFKQERLCETLGLRGRQLQLTDELIALLAPHGASVRLAEAYLRQGDVSTLLKRFDAAERALATSLRMGRERGEAALERNALRSIGLLRWHQGRHAEAVAITEDALAIDRQRGDGRAVAGDLANLGSILRSMGEDQRALATLEEALAMPDVAGDPIKRAYILHHIANVHRTMGDIDRALAYLKDADDSARAHMLPIQRSFHLTSIAHIYLQEGRLADSLRLYQDAVDLSRRARHADGLAQSLRMLGEVLFALGRDQEAVVHLLEAAQLFAQIEDREAETAMRRHVALVLERTASPDAVAAWERVRALAQSTANARAELGALEGIARATRRLAHSGEAAIRRFEEALTLASQLGERGRETELRNTLGILHWERGAYADALSHYEAALGLVRDGGDRVHEGLTLNSIGVTLSRLQRYEEARTALEDALKINRAAGERRLEAHTLAALGEVAHTLGWFDAALGYFEASLTIRREIGDRRGEGWMLYHLARTRTQMGHAVEAGHLLAAATQIAAGCDDAALRRACGLAGALTSPEE